MTGLCDEVSGYETLAELVESHPEIEEAILIYRWEGKRSETVRYGIKLTYSHDTIDWEYSFMGPRDKLIRFASGYGIWDDPDIVFKIYHGLLMSVNTGYDTSEWVEDGTPDPRWRRGSAVSEDNIRLTRVELPSGRGMKL